MFEELNKQMEEASQGIFRLQKINTMINALHEDEKALESKVSELQTILDKEDKDVAKLENKSLAHIFHSILGNVDEKVYKERQEALAARMKYDQAVSDLEQVRNEMKKLKEERINYKGCAYTYEKLFSQKKELLLQSNQEAAERIIRLSKDCERSENNQKEIKEAIYAGNKVLQSLRGTLDSLSSASGWGTWDMIGGGLMTDLIKHSHIDDAKSKASDSQRLLRQFKTELADVKINAQINFQTDGFAKFADFFFDGLIADWVMQSRIHDSEESVRSVQIQVQSVIDKLNRLEKQEEEFMNKTEQEIKKLVAKG